MEISTYKYTTGRDILGPIMMDFCNRLYLQKYALKENAVALFASRGGLRLLHLYNRYLLSKHLTSPVESHQFYISRILAVKASFYQAKDDVTRLILREYRQSSVMHFIDCFYPGNDLNIPDNFIHADLNVQMLDYIFYSTDAWLQPLHNYLRDQRKLLAEHLNHLTKGRKNILLVDTGWSGTTQLLLMQGYPEYVWQGLNFGKWDTWRDAPPHFHTINGIIVQDSQYESSKPETAIIDYHHIIEAPLEPNFASIETLVKKDNGEIMPTTPFSQAQIPPQEGEFHFHGICDYFNNPVPTLAELHKRSSFAKRKLCKMIRYPSLSDIERLCVSDRSRDFGRKSSVPIFMVEKKRKRKNLQLRLASVEKSIWKQGKITQEFRYIHLFINFFYNHRHLYRRFFPARFLKAIICKQ